MGRRTPGHGTEKGFTGHRNEKRQAKLLSDFAKADGDWLDDLLRGISDGAVALAEGDAARFQNAVALRTAPPRSSTAGGKPAESSVSLSTPARPQAEAMPNGDQAPEDVRSALQKLMDRFR